ncbi:MAG TPA: hypothetical protein VFK44_06620 [Bacillales bacterium]|nr:hypothetical protein [Bacillales bacterium]
MKEAINNWLMVGIGVLIIGLLIFGTLYNSVKDKADDMNSEVTGTSLPETSN